MRYVIFVFLLIISNSVFSACDPTYCWGRNPLEVSGDAWGRNTTYWNKPQNIYIACNPGFGYGTDAQLATLAEKQALCDAPPPKCSDGSSPPNGDISQCPPPKCSNGSSPPNGDISQCPVPKCSGGVVDVGCPNYDASKSCPDGQFYDVTYPNAQTGAAGNCKSNSDGDTVHACSDLTKKWCEPASSCVSLTSVCTNNADSDAVAKAKQALADKAVADAKAAADSKAKADADSAAKAKAKADSDAAKADADAAKADLDAAKSKADVAAKAAADSPSPANDAALAAAKVALSSAESASALANSRAISMTTTSISIDGVGLGAGNGTGTSSIGSVIGGTGTGDGTGKITCNDVSTCSDGVASIASKSSSVGNGSVDGLAAADAAVKHPFCDTHLQDVQCRGRDNFISKKLSDFGSVSQVTGTCPTATFDLSILHLGVYTMHSHCDLLESVRPQLLNVARVAAAIIFVLIVISA